MKTKIKLIHDTKNDLYYINHDLLDTLGFIVNRFETLITKTQYESLKKGNKNKPKFVGETSYIIFE